jgi:hypothetical protein
MPTWTHVSRAAATHLSDVPTPVVQCCGGPGCVGGCDHDDERSAVDRYAAGVRFGIDFSQVPTGAERQADRAADEVTRAPRERQSGFSALPGAATSSRPGRPQALHRAAVPAVVREGLDTPGQPLDPGTRGFMESRFGHDFSQVRVHDGAVASRSSKAVGAHAYTVGHEVVFGAGRYAPKTDSGAWLLAHELAHVVQQAHGGVRTVQSKATAFGPASGRPADWEAQVQAAKTAADRLALIQKALAGIGVTVVDATAAGASDAAPTAAHLTEYSAASQRVNYDDNLNGKQGVDRRTLDKNAGYTLHSSGKQYIVLGPLALRDFETAIVTLNHELDHVRQSLSGSRLKGNESELDAWTSSFIRDFHRTYVLADTGSTCYVSMVPEWTPLLDYYHRKDVSDTERVRSVQRIVDYYKATVKAHDGHKAVFRYWVHRSLNNSAATPNIAEKINSELGLGLSATDDRAKIRQFPCGTLKTLTYSAPTLDKPTFPAPAKP